jgi:uncharacterized protein (DUF2345 family)
MSSQGRGSICHGKESPGDAEIIIDADAIHLGNESKSVVFLNGGSILIKAPERIDLECGGAMIGLAKDGTITITGTTSVVMTGGKTASVTLDASSAAIKGQLVKMNG